MASEGLRSEAKNVLAYQAPPYPNAPFGVWRQGKTLVLQRGAVMPTVCIRCGQPTEERPVELKFSNLSLVRGPAVAARGLGSFIVLLAMGIRYGLALSDRRVYRISYCLCTRHRRQRALCTVAVAILIFACIVCVFSSLPRGGALSLVGLALCLAGIGVAFRTPELAIEAVSGGVYRLRGAGAAFLALLPDYRSPRNQVAPLGLSEATALLTDRVEGKAGGHTPPQRR